MKELMYVGSLEEVEFGEAGRWRKGEKKKVKDELATKLLAKGVFKEVKKDGSSGRK